jgi:acetyl esterase/lipase
MKYQGVNIWMLLHVFLLFTACVHGQTEEIPLWRYPIPGSLTNETYQEEIVQDHGIPIRVGQVTAPTLSVFLPEKPNGTAVIIFPGGGYRYLAIHKEGYQVAKWLNSMGITAFVLKYRLPSDEIMENKAVGPLQDAQEAVRFIRRNAQKWDIQSEKIGILGFSAGGHLASTLATQYDEVVYPLLDSLSARPDFSILLYPVISMTDEHTHMGSRNRLLGTSPSAEMIQQFSSENQIDSLTPKTFLVHAVDDKSVPVENSIHYFLALRQNKVRAEMHLYEKGGHGFGLGKTAKSPDWTGTCEAWLRSNNLL